MTRTRHRPSGRPSLRRVAVAGVCLIGLLSGCDLRLETPAPTAPSPGATEVARQRAATDAVAIADLAGLAGGAATAAGSEAAVLDALAEVATASERHATALGGVYRPWPEGPSPDATSAAPTSATAPAPSPAEVVTALEDAAERAADDADTVTDGPLARLLASVAASRAVLASALEARLAGMPIALPTSLAPTEPTPVASGSGSGSGSGAPSGEPTGEPTGAGVVGHVPGIQDSSLTALLESEDVLGAGWEVLAARSSDDARAQAALVATGHRARAQAWATALDVDGTALDPRRDAYALPAEVLDPKGDALTALVALEAQLGDRLAALVSQAGPGSRAAFVDALRANALLVLHAAGTTTAFPGVGDTADGTTSSGQAG